MIAIAINAATSIALSENMPMAILGLWDEGQPRNDAGRTRGPPRFRLLTLAELFHRLVRQIVLAEADRRHQRDVLRRADELLQLGIEGVVEVLVFLAEAEAAMALHRLAGHFTERRGGFD